MSTKGDMSKEFVKALERSMRIKRNRQLELNDEAQNKYKKYVKMVGKGSRKMTKSQYYDKWYPIE